ncbi:MAG: GNAT family N-acetyltransferase [Candidatus Bathyarchaeia archaeon]|jgi:GNAT superfamily N-acetyltransferase
MIAKIRSFKESDLPFLFELLKEPDGEQRLLYMHYGDGNLLSWIQERRLEVLIAEDNCRIIGSAAYNDGHWGEEIEWLVVCKNADAKLVEDMLVKEAEKYVKKGTVFTSVNAGSPKIEEWVQRGYCPNGGLHYMLTRLAGLKTIPKIPESILLRSLKPEEENEFVHLVNTGFEYERVRPGDIRKWKTENPPFDEEWIHVAESNGKLVSVVVAKPDVGYNRFFNAKRGYLGPAATLHEYRGRNLASALTVRAMNSLFEQGMDSVCLFTLETNVPAIKLLRKIGFEIGHSWKFMHKHF